MRYPLLSDADMKSMDALKEHHGGAEKIVSTIRKMRDVIVDFHHKSIDSKPMSDSL